MHTVYKTFLLMTVCTLACNASIALTEPPPAKTLPAPTATAVEPSATAVAATATKSAPPVISTSTFTAPAPSPTSAASPKPSIAPATNTTTPQVNTGGSQNLIGKCPVFPTDNWWNKDISGEPVDTNSKNYIDFILKSRQYLHADFGSNLSYGIPYVVVPQDQPLVPITFTAYGDESDPGPYPIPPNAPVEGGANADGDRHVLVVREGECKLYEMYRSFYNGKGWNADSGAVWDLRSNKLRPAGWTSADAAGLPILPGLVRYEEVSAGKINHALRFTVQTTQRAYILPATHWASSNRDPNAPPMGLRLRLKASYDISKFNGQSRVVLEALKRYGMIVADNGSSWFITGATDSRWNDADLDQMKTVPGSAFEVVKVDKIYK